MSLSMGLLESEFSADDNLYFTSNDSTSSRLSSYLKEEYFVEGSFFPFQWIPYNNFTREIFIALSCLSTKPLDCA